MNDDDKRRMNGRLNLIEGETICTLSPEIKSGAENRNDGNRYDRAD